MAGIVECFLARNQIKYLSPVFTNFCLVSGIVLVSTRQYPSLWIAAQADLEILQKCLSELSKKWRSAIGASKALQRAIDVGKSGRPGNAALPLLRMSNTHEPLFANISDELCRVWSVCQVVADGPQSEENLDTMAWRADNITSHDGDHNSASAHVDDYAFPPIDISDSNFNFGGNLGNWFMDNLDHTLFG